MVNGMDWDGKENVWVADSIENKVTHYRYNKASPRMLEKITEFATDGGVDNIDFDKEENKLYLGTVYRVYDFLAVTQKNLIFISVYKIRKG
jgi:sugar lactone lactonase YvrE